MNNSRAIIAMVSLAFVIAIGAMAGQTGSAAGIVPTVGLGTAATYSVLAGTPVISNTGNTTIDRDVGIHPAASITGFFPPGIIGGQIHPGDAVALQAKNDLTTAYLDAANRASMGTYTNLGGQTILGGAYTLSSLTTDLVGTLTLDGANDPSSVWIFKAPSTLITSSASNMVFIRGGSPCNVFWQVTSSATLGSGSTFVGTIMALTDIHMTDNVTVLGRALARNGDVTLINDHFATSTCSPAPAVVVPPTRPPFTIAPGATATPVPAPMTTFTPAPAATATPIATAASSVTPTTAPTAGPIAAVPTAAPAAVAGTQTAKLPSTSTNDPSGPLTMLGIALTGIGVLLLRNRPIPHL